MSKLSYVPLCETGHVLVIRCPMEPRDDELRDKWASRAVALLDDSSRYLRDVVRDLLANPQVRAIVFDGPACGRDAYDAFWLGANKPEWRIDNEHQDLVKGFVDLYDDDCMWKESPRPFWPVRIMYLEEQPCA